MAALAEKIWTVAVKYLLSTQIVRVQYEGRKRFFSVVSVSHDQISDISDNLGALSMSDVASLYVVDWDTAITIEDRTQASESSPSVVMGPLRVTSVI